MILKVHRTYSSQSNLFSFTPCRRGETTTSTTTNPFMHRSKTCRRTSKLGISAMTSHSFSGRLHDIEEVSKEIDHGSSKLLVFVEDDDYFEDIFAMDSSTRNKNGIENLLETVTAKTSSAMSQRSDIAIKIVYGGEENSKEEHLRSRIQNFVCAKADEDNLNDGSSSFFFDHESSETSESSSTFHEHTKETNDNICSEGKSLQDDIARLSLKLIAICLSQMYEYQSETIVEDRTINFRDPFWVRIIGAIINIIETAANDVVDDEIIGHSLHCLRLLYSLEPIVVKQLLQQSLLPYLIHLKECSATQNLSSVQNEASQLLQSAELI